MAGTEWEAAHLVYVPYCTSDAHMGDGEAVIGDLGVQVMYCPVRVNYGYVFRAGHHDFVLLGKHSKVVICSSSGAGG